MDCLFIRNPDEFQLDTGKGSNVRPPTYKVIPIPRPLNLRRDRGTNGVKLLDANEYRSQRRLPREIGLATARVAVV